MKKKKLQEVYEWLLDKRILSRHFIQFLKYIKYQSKKKQPFEATSNILEAETIYNAQTETNDAYIRNLDKFYNVTFYLPIPSTLQLQDKQVVPHDSNPWDEVLTG